MIKNKKWEKHPLLIIDINYQLLMFAYFLREANGE